MSVVWGEKGEYPHADFKMDVSAAQEIAGVEAVLTHRDIKGSNRLGLFGEGSAHISRSGGQALWRCSGIGGGQGQGSFDIGT